MKLKIRLFLNLRLRIFLTFMKYSPGLILHPVDFLCAYQTLVFAPEGLSQTVKNKTKMKP